MDYEETGEMSITEANDMNVPVNSFLQEEGGIFIWTASNFMPRKQCIADSQYAVKARKKEVLMELVKQYVVPLYQAALVNLLTKGGNYYYEITLPTTEAE